MNTNLIINVVKTVVISALTSLATLGVYTTLKGKAKETSTDTAVE